MAEAALQVHRELSSDIVRRLVARPIRIDARTGTPSLVATAEPARAPAEAPHEEAEPAASDDILRLRTEMAVMKAVLDAERRETARLRARIEDVATPGPVLDEARATRDRWANLVDRLLHAPR